jgi:hypothetical protein
MSMHIFVLGRFARWSNNRGHNDLQHIPINSPLTDAEIAEFAGLLLFS